jgi:hypothetical protein
MRSSLTAKRHFRSVHAINTRLTAGSAEGWDDYMPGKKAEFHQTASNIFGKIEAVEGAGLALFELSQSPDGDVVDTHLQHGSPTSSIHDQFGPRYKNGQGKFLGY